MTNDTAINYEPYGPQTCAYHCSGSMLPVDGERDAADGLRLLFAREWRPCFVCTVGMNPDLNCNPSVSVPVMVGDGGYVSMMRLVY